MFGHLMFHVLLATLWCLLVQDFSLASVLVGFIASGLVLILLRQMTGKARFFYKLTVFARLLLFFVYELVVANLQVAWLILRPRLRVQPAFIRLPIELKTDLGITSLANMISLTPGTISVDVADDRASLVVHCLNVTDIAATKRTIKHRFEAQLKELEQPG